MNMNLVPCQSQTDTALEFHIDTETNRVYASHSAISRMLEIDKGHRALRKALRTVSDSQVLTAEIQTKKGVRTVSAYPAEVVLKLAQEFNRDLAFQMGVAGANVFMLGLAGYEVKPQPKAPELDMSDPLVCEMSTITRTSRQLVVRLSNSVSGLPYRSRI